MVSETKLLLQRNHIPPHRRRLFYYTMQMHYPEISPRDVKRLEQGYFRRYQYNEPAYVAMLSMLAAEIPRIAPEKLHHYLVHDGQLSAPENRSGPTASAKSKESLATKHMAPGLSRQQQEMQAFMDWQLERLREYATAGQGEQEDGLKCARCQGTRFDIVEKQNRAADEPGAQHYVCSACGAQIEIQS
jgi:DNA-directed RNA polymerase subunit M/transcription elongation factor TFIIS